MQAGCHCPEIHSELNAQLKKWQNFPTPPAKLFMYIFVYTATFFVKLGHMVVDSFVHFAAVVWSDSE